MNMAYSIRSIGDKHCLYRVESGKKIGCHITKQSAEAQLRTIESLRTASAATVKLTLPDDSPIWMNPSRVISISQIAGRDWSELHLNDKTFITVLGTADDVKGLLAGVGALDRSAEYQKLLDGAHLPDDMLALRVSAQGETHPFAYCMDTVVPAMEAKGQGPDDPEAFCGWWKSQRSSTRHASARRELVLRGAVATADIRTAQFESRDHVVLPIVALMEGVIWPINAPEPEFVPVESFSTAPQGWNGRPVFCGHPKVGDEQVSGNTPSVLETAFGRAFGAHVDGRRLLMEAWIDPEKARALGGASLETLERVERIRAGKSQDVIEVSVGAFVVTEDRRGRYGDRDYAAAWVEVIPDHLALLPPGEPGACSAEMGCGVRAARAHMVTAKGFSFEGGPVVNKRKNVLQRLAGFLRVLHYEDEDLGMSDQDKRKSLEEALRKVDPTVSYIEAVYDDYVVYCAYPREMVMTGPMGPATTYFQRAYMCEEDGTITFSGNSVEVEPVMHYEPVEALMTAKGARHSSKDMAIVQAMHDQSVELGAQCGPTSASGHPDAEEITMKTEDRAKKVKALQENAKVIAAKFAAKAGGGDILTAIVAQIVEKLGLSEDAAAAIAELPENVLVELAGLSAPPAAGDKTPPADGTGSATPAYTGAQAKPKTAEEWMAEAPQEVRDVVADAKARDAARKTALIATLKGKQTEYTEAELAKMSTKDIERLVKVCKADVPAVDFGLNVPRAAEGEKQTAPEPPSMIKILQDRAKK